MIVNGMLALVLNSHHKAVIGLAYLFLIKQEARA
jgi:hypothetical protein